MHKPKGASLGCFHNGFRYSPGASTQRLIKSTDCQRPVHSELSRKPNATVLRLIRVAIIPIAIWPAPRIMLTSGNDIPARNSNNFIKTCHARHYLFPATGTQGRHSCRKGIIPNLHTAAAFRAHALNDGISFE